MVLRSTPVQIFLADATRLIRSEILHQFSVRSDTTSRQCHRCLHEETTGNDPLRVHAGPAWKSPRISVGSTVKYARGVLVNRTVASTPAGHLHVGATGIPREIHGSAPCKAGRTTRVVCIHMDSTNT
ncbi:hypothetical protein PSTT_08977 [Puccinia striiformis]|uniref:Uncharacterized protein n=2 Tax=Puccinia striiformis TaxID=27350 RepID=A0A0L0V9L9_9BASI|nr:hypothetical protein PSTG_10765 [Puccinia striiformis f. sp. tritici PST-78]POW06463.1 hypothetical protein PSTT_08977 [Puccinia striiformis]